MIFKKYIVKCFIYRRLCENNDVLSAIDIGFPY